MDPNRERLLKEVMAADFTLIDLALYLNTHPTDQRALALYRNAVQHAMITRQKFEQMYGPLTQLHGADCNTWRWIESPWPWEK
jgi:spore coat protein JB